MKAIDITLKTTLYYVNFSKLVKTTPASIRVEKDSVIVGLSVSEYSYDEEYKACFDEACFKKIGQSSIIYPTYLFMVKEDALKFYNEILDELTKSSEKEIKKHRKKIEEYLIEREKAKEI